MSNIKIGKTDLLEKDVFEAEDTVHAIWNVFSDFSKIEHAKMKESCRIKNKDGAIECLIRKKLYEHRLYRICEIQMRIYEQIVAISRARGEMPSNTEENLFPRKKIVIEDLSNMSREELKRILNALSGPICTSVADLDQEELEEALEDLDAEYNNEKPEVEKPIPPISYFTYC